MVVSTNTTSALELKPYVGVTFMLDKPAMSATASLREGARAQIHWTNACPKRPLKSQCTTGSERRIARWEPVSREDTGERQPGPSRLSNGGRQAIDE